MAKQLADHRLDYLYIYILDPECHVEMFVVSFVFWPCNFPNFELFHADLSHLGLEVAAFDAMQYFETPN